MATNRPQPLGHFQVRAARRRVDCSDCFEAQVRAAAAGTAPPRRQRARYELIRPGKDSLMVCSAHLYAPEVPR